MNHPQPNYKSKCETCGVYYQGEHNCGTVLCTATCDVCGIDVTHFAYVKPEIALAEHKKGIYCLFKDNHGQPDIKPDMVNSPPHYNAGGVECIDAIRAALGHDGFIAYCRGNVIKYQFRADHKNGKEDLKKAVWYSRMAAGDDPRAV